MLEQLCPTPGQRILEIGAGTGYNAAILARLLGEDGRVTTLDIDREIVDGACRNLSAFGLGEGERKPGFAPIEALASDGILGAPDGAPWDGILVTVRSGYIPKAWFEQLAPGGRLVVPLTLGGMRQGELSMAFVKRQGFLESDSSITCDFIRPRGGMAVKDRELELDERPGLYWCDGGHYDASKAEIRHLLEAGPRLHATGLSATAKELIGGFQIWLVLHEPETCTMQASKTWATWPHLFPMVEIPGRTRGAGGLFDGRSIALLAFEDSMERGKPRPLSIATYGEDGRDIALRLIAQLRAWDRAGRPPREKLRVRVFAPGTAIPEAETPAAHVRQQNEWGLLEASWP